MQLRFQLCLKSLQDEGQDQEGRHVKVQEESDDMQAIKGAKKKRLVTKCHVEGCDYDTSQTLGGKEAPRVVRGSPKGELGTVGAPF